MDKNIKSPTPHKRRALVLLGAGVALLFLLATSLSDLRLWPGQPFSLPFAFRPLLTADGAAGDGTVPILLRILLAFALLSLPITLVWALLDKNRRKRLLINLIVIAALYWLLRTILRPGDALQLNNLPSGIRLSADDASVDTAPLPALAPNPSDAAVWIATLAVALLIVACAAGLILWLRRRQRPSPLQALASEAQEALDAIQAGGPLEHNIERCYRDMCAVLQHERNMERGASMTPTEFVNVLQVKGLPIAPFQQLTRLFEDLRYGNVQPGAREEQLAVDSLRAIVEACQSYGRGAKRGGP